ncbi:CD209 antigen-like protein A [Lissotriton helveticus]
MGSGPLSHLGKKKEQRKELVELEVEVGRLKAEQREDILELQRSRRERDPLPENNYLCIAVVKDLERKLRLWRIIAPTVTLLITIILVLITSIFFLTVKKGIDNSTPQMLKTDVCVNNAPSCTYCPSNWIYHSGNCYFFSIDSLNWTASRDNCRHMDSQLAVIKNREEDTFIELTGQGPTWMGLSKAQNGSWIWEDGTLLGGSFWQYDEPNNNGGVENCVGFFNVFYNSSGWNDSQCQLLKRSLCKRPAGVLPA